MDTKPFRELIEAAKVARKLAECFADERELANFLTKSIAAAARALRKARLTGDKKC